MRVAVIGDTALASITSACVPCTDRATSTAAWGGTTDKINSAFSRLSALVKPAAAARRAVSSLRPCGSQRTS